MTVETDPSPAFRELIAGAFAGDLDRVGGAVADGAPVGHLDPETGLSALHIAVGQNDGALCRLLIEKYEAPFGADQFGRWPSVVAIECRVDDDFADYVTEKEAAFIARSESTMPPAAEDPPPLSDPGP